MNMRALDGEELGRIAEPMMDDIMSGWAQRDFSLHSRNFSVDLKARYSPENFAERLDRHAEWSRPGARQLLHAFRKERSVTLTWHQLFDGSEDEVVALVTIALKGGRYFVDEFLLA